MGLSSIKEQVLKIVLKEHIPFVEKREINWPIIAKMSGIFLFIFIVILLSLPQTPDQPEEFSGELEKKLEKRPEASADAREKTPSEEALILLSPDKTRSKTGAKSQNNEFWQEGISTAGSNTGKANSRERSGRMIIVPPGKNGRNQLSQGLKLKVRLSESILISQSSVPVIGIITKDVWTESGLAIPEGTRIFGDLSFEESSKRVKGSFHSLEEPGGRQRSLAGVALGLDGHLGLTGRVHSDSWKNTSGKLISNFLAAYAQGSMTKGQNGSYEGGSDNGLKNAVSETAKSIGADFAEDLKKETSWCEVDGDFLVLLTEPYVFRDPGGTGGL